MPSHVELITELAALRVELNQARADRDQAVKLLESYRELRKQFDLSMERFDELICCLPE